MSITSPLQNFMRAPVLDAMSKISRLSTAGEPQEEFLYSVISEWNGSTELEDMLTAQEYFANRSDVKDKKREIINRLGVLEEAKNLANNKLHHPWLRKLTRQKVAYLLTNPITVTSKDSKAKALVDEMTKLVDKDFTRALQQYGTQAIVNKLSWMQVYYSTEGKLRFKRIPTEEVIPFWRDAEHTELDGLVRVYSITVYEPNGDAKELKKVEFWCPEGVWYYEMGEDGLIPDSMRYVDMPEGETPGPEGHFQVKAAKEGDEPKQAAWQRVPWIAFKYNAEEQSLLQQVKSLIDDYDERSSGVADMLQDIPNNIKVVTNYDGSDKQEFVHNLATYRVAFLRENGALDQIESNLDITAVEKHLDRLRKDIIDAGGAVDTQEDTLGNSSGVAIRFRYSDLDLDCAAMGTEFKAALERLAWFVAVDMSKGAEEGTDGILDLDLDFEFEPAGVINEAEAIKNVKESLSVLSLETAIEHHPWTEDAPAELVKVKAERKERIKELEEGLPEDYGKLSPNGDKGPGTPTPTPGTTE